VEGAGSYGAGLAALLHARGERVVEAGRPHDHPLAPRRREALRVLLATRHSACIGAPANLLLGRQPRSSARSPSGAPTISALS
jgi:hypothetical protein